MAASKDTKCRAPEGHAGQESLASVYGEEAFGVYTHRLVLPASVSVRDYDQAINAGKAALRADLVQRGLVATSCIGVRHTYTRAATAEEINLGDPYDPARISPDPEQGYPTAYAVACDPESAETMTVIIECTAKPVEPREPDHE